MTGEKAPITSTLFTIPPGLSAQHREQKALSSCGRRLVADSCPLAGSHLTVKLINKTKQRTEKCMGQRVLELLDPAVPEGCLMAQYPRYVGRGTSPN